MSPQEIEAIARAGKVEALKEAAVEQLVVAIELIKMIGTEDGPPNVTDRVSRVIQNALELVEEAQLE